MSSRKRRERASQSPPELSGHVQAPSGEKTDRKATPAIVVFFCLIAAVGGLWWLMATPSGPEPFRPLNIVIVTADTLRADRLPSYGYARIKTPHLDRMAAEGTVFEQAQTVIPLTLPAHSSMFTGTYPMYHGVRDNGGYYLGEDRQTLAETLRDQGYATGAFIAAFVLDGRWGLDQGFDRYFDDFDFNKYERIALDTVQRRGDEVLETGLEWMSEVKDGPFFSWLHFYDIHTPHDPPEPYLSQVQGYPWARYDGEIVFVDHLMGRLQSWLEENDLADDTAVVFIGDHGESLGQHEEMTHGFFIYDATMHVPFILKTPYRQIPRGGRIAAQVSTIDLMPTLLELVGVAAPHEVQGSSLVPLLTGEADDLGLIRYSESLYPRHHYGWAELKSLRNGRLHYIAAPRPELYDVREDPRQEKNLADERPGQVSQLQAQLDDIFERYSLEGVENQTPVSLDADTQAQLAALGYLGGPSKIKVDPDKPLADPKDKIHLFNLIKEAGSDSSEDRVDEAFAKIERVLDEDPGILEAYNIKGNLQVKKGESEQAIRSYQEALGRDSEYKPALFGLATTYKELGRLDDAATGFERVIELDDRDNRAFFMLAQVRAEQKSFRQALDILERAVETGSERAPAHNLMAECYIGLEDLERAEGEVRKALEMNPTLPTAYYNLALIHEGRDQFSQAVTAYEQELEHVPKDFKTHFNLGKLYGQLGNQQKMIDHFERSVEYNERFAIGHLFLAKYRLDHGELEEATRLAKKGIELKPEPSMAPLGHFILADIYNRQGRLKEAEAELTRARRLSES